MKMREFQALPEGEQVALLYEDGVYIGKRIRNTRTVLLYQLESFYVEIDYEAYRRHVRKITCTGSIDVLDPYLEQIDVLHFVN